MIKKISTIISLFFLTTIIQAQNNEDALQYKTYDELIELSESYIEKKEEEYTEKEIQIITDVLREAKIHKDTLQISNAYKYHSWTYRNHKEAYLDSIIDLTEDNANKEYPGYAYIEKAGIYFLQKRNIKETLYYLNLARTYAKNNDNQYMLYRVDYFLGVVRSEHLGEKEKALESFKRCARFFSNTIEPDDKYKYLYILHAIAEVYVYLQKNDSASFYNELGYNEAIQSSDSDVLNTCLLYTSPSPRDA